MIFRRVVYIHDTLCGWCNVARPEINKLFAALEGQIPMVALHRRLFTDGFILPIDDELLQKVRHIGWEVGPRMTGQKFSEKYMQLLQSQGFENESHLSSLACTTALLLSDNTTSFHYSERLQGLVFDYGLNPNDVETLYKAAKPLEIEEEAFLNKLIEKETVDATIQTSKETISIQNELNAQGVPILLLEEDGRFTQLDPYNASNSLSEIQKVTGAHITLTN